MGKVLRVAGVLSACALYTIFVGAIMLWFFFPANFVRQWIPSYIASKNPEWQVDLQGVELLYPGSLVLSNLKAVDSKREQQVFIVNQIVVKPQIQSLIKLKPRILFEINLYSGRMSGELEKEDNLFKWQVQGNVTGVDIGLMEAVRSLLQREITGKIDAVFSGMITVDTLFVENGNAEFDISHGNIPLRESVMGHTVIPFTNISGYAGIDGDIFFVKKGKAVTDLFTANFEGDVGIKKSVAQSVMSFTGSLIPELEFFKHVDNQSVLSVIRAQFDEEYYPFYVSGQVVEPAVSFGDYSAIFDSILLN